MNLTAIVALGIIAALLSIILKQYKPEFGLYISLIAGVIILMAVVSAVKPVLEVLEELNDAVDLNAIYGAVLLKALAICYITQLATDACRDSGEAAIAGKVETAGKLALVLVSLPLFKSVVDVIIKLFEI